MVYASKNKNIELLLWDSWVCRPSRFRLLIIFLYLFPFSRLCPEMLGMCLCFDLLRAGMTAKKNYKRGNLSGQSGLLCLIVCKSWDLRRDNRSLWQRMCHFIWLQREELQKDCPLRENHQMRNRLLEKRPVQWSQSTNGQCHHVVVMRYYSFCSISRAWSQGTEI